MALHATNERGEGTCPDRPAEFGVVECFATSSCRGNRNERTERSENEQFCPRRSCDDVSRTQVFEASPGPRGTPEFETTRPPITTDKRVYANVFSIVEPWGQNAKSKNEEAVAEQHGMSKADRRKHRRRKVEQEDHHDDCGSDTCP